MVATLGDEKGARWLEPSHGEGIFLECLREAGVPRERIRAIDLDPRRESRDRLAVTLRGRDFLDWAGRTRLRFDRIVGNPPYVPIDKLSGALASSAASVSDMEELPIGRGANIWYAFVLQCIRLLKEGGSMALVLPSACEYANYCERGRKSLLSMFDRVDVYRSEESPFRPVYEGNVVVVATSRKGKDDNARGKIRRHTTKGLGGLTSALLQERSSGRDCDPERRVSKNGCVRLGDLIDFQIGGVTGDTNYFVLSESERLQLGLPCSALRPVISKARQLRYPSIGKKELGLLREDDERIWLFSPPPRMEEHAQVRSYLDLPEHEGGCHRDRFKVQARECWFRPRMPTQVDGFVSGMASPGPWLCFADEGRLTATNTLYVARYLSDADSYNKYAVALTLLTSEARRQLRRQSRRYPKGLQKVEPSVLLNLMVPIPSGRPDRRTYARAVSAFLKGDLAASSRIADSAVSAE